MQKRRVDWIDADLERLQPVAIDHPLERKRVAVGRNETVEMWKRRRLTWAEMREQDAVLLHHRIRLLPDVGAKIAVLGFGRSFEALAVDIEQPAVKCAAQAAVLEPSVCEISAAVRATACDQSVTAALVPEDDKVFTQQTHRFDRTIAGQFIDQCRRLPIAPQQASRRCAGTGPGNEIVLLDAQHGRLSLLRKQTLYEVSRGQKAVARAQNETAGAKAGRKFSCWVDQLGRVAQPVSMRRRQAVWRRPRRRCAAVLASARLVAAHVRYSRSATCETNGGLRKSRLNALTPPFSFRSASA